jgi:hypothetical protein
MSIRNARLLTERRSCTPHLRYAPALERLEDRTVLSPLSFTNSAVWLSEGPAPIQDGGTTGIDMFTNVQNRVAGAIQAVAVDPKDSHHVFVGAVNGGVWGTDNATDCNPVQDIGYLPYGEAATGTVSWTPLTDQFPSLSIGALAFGTLDTNTPLTETVYAGTANMSSSFHDGGPHTGLLRTLDGGYHWAPFGEGLDNLDIRSIVPTGMQGAQGEIILVAGSALAPGAPGGVYANLDGGSFFTRVLFGPNVSDLAVSRGNGPTSFYAAVPSGGPNGGPVPSGIFRSTDGVHWDHFDTGLNFSLPDGTDGFANALRIRLSAQPQSIYAAIIDIDPSDNKHRAFGMFHNVTTDPNAAWQSMDIPDDGSGGINPGGQAETHFSIAADPFDGHIVFVGGDQGHLVRGDWSRPAGSGQQWQSITFSGANPSTLTYPGWPDGTKPHDDSRNMAFDRDGNLLEVDDGGIYRLIRPEGTPSNNLDPSQGRQWVSVNGNLQITEYYSVTYDPNSHVILGASQDNGISYQSQQDGQLWTGLHFFRALGTSIPDELGGFVGDGIEVAVTPPISFGPLSIDTRFTLENNVGAFERQDFNQFNQPLKPSREVLLAATGSHTPLSGLNAADQASANSPAFDISHFALNANDPSRMVVGTPNGLYESMDEGDHINEITFPGMGSVVSLAYGGAGNNDAVYLGTTSGFFLRDSAGGPVRAIPPPALTGSMGFDNVKQIVLDPGDWHTAFIVGGEEHPYVFKVVTQVNDDGSVSANWINLTGNLNTLTTDLRCIQLVNGIPVVGGRGGVFRTLDPLDPSPSWNRLGAMDSLDMPNGVVASLHFDPMDNVLIAGTFGRGAWKLKDATTAVATGNTMQIVGNNESANNYEFQRAPNSSTMLRVFVNSGSPTLIPFATLNHISIDGIGNDTLTLDYTFGDPVPLGLGIDFAYGSGSASVVVIGNGSDSGSYTPDPAVTGEGTVMIDGRVVNFFSDNVEFPGTPSLLVGGLNSFTLSTPNPGNSLNIATADDGMSEINGTSGGVAFTPLEFNGIANLTIDTAGGDGSSTASDHVFFEPNVVQSPTGADEVLPGTRNLVLKTGNGDDSLTVLTPTFDLGGVPQGVLIGSGSNILRYDYATGDQLDANFLPGAQPNDAIIGPDGNLYVLRFDPIDVGGFVERYDGQTLAPLPSAGNAGAVFVAPGQVGVFGEGFKFGHMAFGPDGNLYITEQLANAVMSFDGQTGKYIGELPFSIDGRPGLQHAPSSLAFDQNGNLYVAYLGGDTTLPVNNPSLYGNVFRLNSFGEPFAAPADAPSIFVANPGQVAGNPFDLSFLPPVVDVPTSVAFGPDGNLYVANITNRFDINTNNVKRYSGIDGSYLPGTGGGDVIPPSSNGLNNPGALTFGPDGKLYVASSGPTGMGDNTVKCFDPISGNAPFDLLRNIPGTPNFITFMGSFIWDGGGGNNDIVAESDVDYTLSDQALTSSDGGTITLIHVNQANLAGGMSANHFFVQNWSGTATLDGVANANSYVVDFKGSGSGRVNVIDHGNPGSTLTVVGSHQNEVISVLDSAANPQIRRSNAGFTLEAEVVTYSGIAGVSVIGGSGNDSFNVNATTLPVEVTTGGGTSTVKISPIDNNLANIAGPLTVHGYGHSTLVINDQGYGAFTNDYFGVDNTLHHSTFRSVVGFFPFSFSHGATIAFNGLTGVTYNGSGGGSTTDVESAAAGMAIQINCSTGADHVFLSNSAHDLSAIQANVAVGGTGGGDQLVINDQAYNGFTDSTLDGAGFHASTHGFLVSYSGLAGVTFNGSNYNTNQITVESAAAGTPVTINCGSGRNYIYFSRAAQDLSAIQSPVTLNGGTGQAYLTLNDQAFDGFTANTVTASSFSSLVHGSTISFSNLALLTLNVSNHNTHQNTFPDSTTVVESTAQGTPVNVNCGSGRDYVALSETAQNLDTIQSTVSVNGGGGHAELGLYDKNAAESVNNTITGTTLVSHRSHSTVSVYYSGLASLTFTTATAGNNGTTDIESTLSSMPVTVNASGADNVVLAGDTQSLDNIQGTVTVNESAGTNAGLTLNDQADANAVTYTIDSGLTYRTGVANIHYSGLLNLVVNGGSGTDHYQVQSTAAHTIATLIHGSGQNSVSVGDINDPLSGIQGPVWVEGASGSYTLAVDDEADTAPATYEVTSITISGGGSAAIVHLASEPPASATLTGGAGDNTLVAGSGVNGWHITGRNAGSAGIVSFTKIGSLTGSGDYDTFQFANGASVSGVIDGGAGTNTLDYSQYTSGIAVNLTAGTATGTGGIRNIQKVVGTSAGDSFTGNGQGTFVGNGGNDSITSTSGNDTFVLGPNQGNRTVIHGAGSGTTLVGAAAANVWHITGHNAGKVNNIPFTGIGSLVGGSVTDAFQFGPSGSLDGAIDGGGGNATLDYSGAGGHGITLDLADGSATRLHGGTAPGFARIQHLIGSGAAADSLIGPDAANTWMLTASNTGTLNGTVTFAKIANLTGGALTDSFLFGVHGSVTGRIDGGSGSNTLDYSANGGRSITVNLANGSATSIHAGRAGGFANIQALVGSSSLGARTHPTNRLLAANTPNAWHIAGSNSGNINGAFLFSGIQNLTGGSTGDIFQFADSAGVSGVINGGNSKSWLDYSQYMTPVAVNLATGKATGAGGGIQRIGNVQGGAGGNTLKGNAQGNILIGGSGVDTITAGIGRSVLISGTGPGHILTGGSAADILISGTTDYDHNYAALLAILTEWRRTDRTYTQRIADLRNGGDLNGPNILIWGGTVRDNSSADTLTGGGGLNWYLANLGPGGAVDTLANRKPAEQVD